MWQLWSNMKSTSRIWPFQLSCEVDPSTEIEILSKLEVFCNTWTSHNATIMASATICERRFIFIAAEASQVSGCSQDGLRNAVNNIVCSLGLSILGNNHVVWTDAEGKWHSTDWLGMEDLQLAEIKRKAIRMYSPLPLCMEELYQSWPLTAKDSVLLR